MAGPIRAERPARLTYLSSRRRPNPAHIIFCGQAVISPLLSNLCMRRFVLGWKQLGHEKRLAAHIVNYTDDLVICCRGQAEEALARM